MITEQDILTAMEEIERDGIFVSCFMFTQEVWEFLGKPKTYKYAAVKVGDRNVAMSDPEFYRCVKIPFEKPKPSIWEKLFGNIHTRLWNRYGR